MKEEIKLIAYISSFTEMNEVFEEARKLEKEGHTINIEIRYKKEMVILKVDDKQEKTVLEYIEEKKDHLRHLEKGW